MNRKINLFTSFYQDKNQDRASELADCLLKNSTDKNINRVILLNNPRPSYKDFFILTQQFPEDINIISNTDIHFDETIRLLYEVEFTRDVCFALTRWNVNKDESLTRMIDRGSQDAWIFFGSVKNIDQMDASYTMGKPGCDNRIAWELNNAGYMVYNPSESIRIIHRHKSDVRNYKESEKIYGEHLLLDATRLDNMKTDTNYYNNYLEKPSIISEEPIDASENIESVDKLSEYIPFNPLKVPQADSKAIQVRDRLRIQHIALMKGHTGFPRALKKLGDYDEIDFSSLLSAHGVGGMNQIIVERFNYFKPDLVFMQIQVDNVFLPETAKHISERAFLMHWGGDKRSPLPQYFTSIAPYVSVTCCSCEEDVLEMRNNGWNADFLQIGFDPEIYKYGLEKVSPCPQILFMGNNYEDMFPMSKSRTEMIQIMKTEFGEDFGAYGNGWNFQTESFNADQITEARYYNSCKIAINYNHFDTDRYTSDRIFRLMASGACCISHKYKGIEKDFQPGIHLETFENFKELTEKCRQLLSDDERRNRIAHTGYQYVHSKYTFDHMAQNIINIYNKYKNESIGIHTTALR